MRIDCGVFEGAVIERFTMWTPEEVGGQAGGEQEKRKKSSIAFAGL
jgi:hypothetical protein